MNGSSLGAKVAVLGAGNGGQALAAYFTMRGHEVRLWNRSAETISTLEQREVFQLQGVCEGRAKVHLLTTDLTEAVASANTIVITTVANAHLELAVKLSPLLKGDVLILLCPGRTGGALEVAHYLQSATPGHSCIIAESQSLPFACRIVAPGLIHVIGVKDFLPVATVPGQYKRNWLGELQCLFPGFCREQHVLATSLENIGCVLHPVVMLLNADAIEKGTYTYFYRDLTDSVCEMIFEVDEERLRLGRAYGLKLLPVMDWIRKAYPHSRGRTFRELITHNPAYGEIRAPQRLSSRLLTEDVPMGLVPLWELGKTAGIQMPVTESLIHLSSKLLGENFIQSGRTLRRLGMDGKSPAQIIERVSSLSVASTHG